MNKVHFYEGNRNCMCHLTWHKEPVMVHNVQPRLHNGRLLFIAIGCSVLAAIAATYLSFTFLSLGKFPYMWSSVEPFYFGSAISTLLICPFFWQIYLRHKTEASSLG